MENLLKLKYESCNFWIRFTKATFAPHVLLLWINLELPFLATGFVLVIALVNLTRYKESKIQDP
jgi:hypothetical protein